MCVFLEIAEEGNGNKNTVCDDAYHSIKGTINVFSLLSGGEGH